MGPNFIASGTPSNVRRWDKTAQVYTEVEVPEIIKVYNSNMGGVDKVDQMLSYIESLLNQESGH